MTKIKTFTWLSSSIIILSLCNTLIAQQLEEYVPKIIIQAKWGNGPGEFGLKTFGEHGLPIMPNAMAVDRSQNIYILDPLNHRIQKFSKEGKFEKSISYGSGYDFFDEIVPLEVDKNCNIFLKGRELHTGNEIILVLDRNGNLICKLFPQEFNCDRLSLMYDEESDEVVIFCSNKEKLRSEYSEFRSDGRKFKILPNGKKEVYRGRKKIYNEIVSEQRIDKNAVLLKIEQQQILVKLYREIADKGLSLGRVLFVRKDKKRNINVFITAIPEEKYMSDRTKWKWFLYKYDENKNLISVIDRKDGEDLLYPKGGYGLEYIDCFGNYYKLLRYKESGEGVKVIKWVPKSEK